ncbi:MAG: L,D-transpeptidase family protein [Clostridiales bacterium]
MKFKIFVFVIFITSLIFVSACSKDKNKIKEDDSEEIVIKSDKVISELENEKDEITEEPTLTPTASPTQETTPTLTPTIKPTLKTVIVKTAKPVPQQIISTPKSTIEPTQKPTPKPAPYYIIINKSTNQLYLYNNNVLSCTYSIATGREASLTPEGTFTIVNKIKNPSWKDPNTSKIIPGGDPTNPLGNYWLGLSVGGGSIYGIHGTNNESSIGTYASGGCIRMNNSQIIQLFNIVPTGTTVRIGRYQSVPKP